MRGGLDFAEDIVTRRFQIFVLERMTGQESRCRGNVEAGERGSESSGSDGEASRGSVGHGARECFESSDFFPVV